MKISQLALQLKPYAAGWFQEWANNGAIRTGSSSNGSTGGGSAGAHYIWDETVHLGDLLEVQAPWAATKVELATHAAQPDVHHYRAASGSGITVDISQTVSLNIAATNPGLELSSNAVQVGLIAGLYIVNGQIGIGTPGQLSSTSDNGATYVARNSPSNSHTHAITSYSDQVANPGHLVKTTSDGDVTLRWITANKILASTWLYFETGNGIQFQNEDLLRSAFFEPSFPIGGWQINEVPGVAGKSALTIGAIQADELYVRIFVANEVRVDRGEFYLAKSFGITTADFVTPAAVFNGTGSPDSTHQVRVYFEDSPALNGAIFTANDWIMFNLYDDSGGGLTVSQIWGQVTSYIDEDPGRLREQSWLFTLRSGRTAWTVKKGSFCVGWGQSGQGIIKMSTIDLAGNPYIKLTRWTGSNPYTPANHSTLVHLGKLSAAPSTAVGPLGQYGLMLYGASGQSVEVSESGIYLVSAAFKSYFDASHKTVDIAPTGNVKFGTNVDAVPNTTFEFNSTTGALRVGPGSGGPYLNWSGSVMALRNSGGTDVIQLDSNGNSLFTGIMRIGTTGEIRQGTVTSGNVNSAWPLTGYTGLRVWNDTGIGRIAGYAAIGGVTTLQWSASTSGELRAGGELVSLSSTGLGFGHYTNLTGGVAIPTTDNQRAISWWSDINVRTGAPIARIYGGKTDGNEPALIIEVDPGNANANYRPSIWLYGRWGLPTQLWFNHIDDIIGIPGFYPTYNNDTELSTVYIQPTGSLYIRQTMERYPSDPQYDIGTAALPFRKLYVDEVVASTITGGTQITGSVWQYDSGDMYLRSLSAGLRTLFITNPGAGSMNVDIDGNIIVGGTVDGVDVSSLGASVTTHINNPDAHHARVHVLATTAALSSDHTISGGIVGYTLRVTGATTAALAQLLHTDLGGVTADQHHAQVHTFDGSDHSGTLSWVKVNKTGASLADLPTRLYADLQTRSHVLATNAGLGADHSISGASPGWVLRSTNATTASFAQLQHADLGGVTADQHHAQVHSIIGSDHTVTAAQYQIIGATAANVLGLLTPSSSPGANVIAMTDITSRLSLINLTVGNAILANGGVDYGADTLIEDGTYLQLAGTKPLNTAVTLRAAGWSMTAAGALSAVGGAFSTSVTTPLIDTLVGINLTLQPKQDLILDPDSNMVRTAASVGIQSSNYTSQVTGWGITAAGGADFRYLFVDEMHAKSFIADLEQALAGGQIISKSVAALAADFVAPNPTDTLATVTFRSRIAATSSTATLTCAKPTGTVQNDLMLAHVVYRDTTTITAPPSGWTLLTSVTQTGSAIMSIYYKIAGASEGVNYTWTMSTTGESIVAVTTFYNVDLIYPINAFGGQGNASSTSVAAPSITTTVANCMLVFLAGFNDSNVTGASASPPSGMTERGDTTGSSRAWNYTATVVLAAAGASGTKTALLAATHPNVAALVALRPAVIPATTTLIVKDLPSAQGMAAFQANDIVRLRTFSRAAGSLTIGDCWGTVTNYVSNGDKTQTWTFTRSPYGNGGIVANGTVIPADSLVLDYGVSGNGYYEVNAIDGAYAENSPYAQVVTWTDHPAQGANRSVRTRFGNLVGVTGQANEFGLFAGTKASVGALANTDTYLRVSSFGVLLNNVPIKIFDAFGTQMIGIETWNNVWFGPNSGAKKLYWNGTTLAIEGEITVTGGNAVTTTTLTSELATKISNGGAAGDINGNVTTINGGKITTGSITALQLAANTITANKLSVTAGGDNLIANSSFESDPNGDLVGDGFGVYNNTAGLQPSTPALVSGRLGGLAQRVSWAIANTSTKGVYFGNWNGSGRKANVWYCISWWAKTTTSAAVGFDTYHNVAPTTTEWILQPTPVNNVWQRWAKRMMWNADAADSWYVSITQGAAVTGYVDFDDVMVHEGDTLQSYAPRAAEILPGTITGEQINLGSYVAINSATWGANGVQMQYNGGSPRFYAGNGSADYIKYEGGAVSVSGNLSAAGGVFQVNSGGLTIKSSSSGTPQTINSLRFVDSVGTTTFGGLYSFYTSNTAYVNMRAVSTDTAHEAWAQLDAVSYNQRAVVQFNAVNSIDGNGGSFSLVAGSATSECSIGTDSIRLFSGASGQYSLLMNAVGGLAFTGTSFTYNGSTVYHTGNLNPAAYAPLSGAVFSGGITATGFATTGAYGQIVVASRTGVNAQEWIVYNPDGGLKFYAPDAPAGNIFIFNKTGVLNITGRNGAVDIGPQNTSYCHFTTDRGAFYFNTHAVFNGNLSSYAGDLYISRVSTNRIGLFTWGTYVYAHLTMDDVFAMNNVQVSEPATPSSGVKLYLWNTGARIELRAKFANGGVKTITWNN